MCVLLCGTSKHAWQMEVCAASVNTYETEREDGISKNRCIGYSQIAAVIPIFLFSSIFLWHRISCKYIRFTVCFVCNFILDTITVYRNQHTKKTFEEESRSSKVSKKIISSLIVKPDLWTDMMVQFSLLLFFCGNGGSRSSTVRILG